MESSVRDGGIGRNSLLPHTTKRRITTNLKTKNQKSQKVILHGTLTTEELKKHSFRLVGGVDMGSQRRGCTVKQQTEWLRLGLANQVVPHSCVDKLRGRRGARQTVTPRLSVRETKDSKALAIKSVVVAKVGEIPSLTGESIREAHGILEHTQPT